MEVPIHRPTPRRVFDITPASADSSRPPTPPIDSPRQSSESNLLKSFDASSPPSRARSILNLTSSTLAGIYSKTTGDGGRDEPPTPWGSGAQTPAYRQSIDASDRQEFFRISSEPQSRKPRRASMRKPRSGVKNYYLPLLWQTLYLFIFGVGFGLLVTQLQRTQHITPVPVPSFAKNVWAHQLSWGLLGVVVGNALPRIDSLFNEEEDAIVEDDIAASVTTKLARTRSNAADASETQRNALSDHGLGPLWHSAVRSVGAFVGIAYAVRRVPWSSTLQVSLTLAAVNPVLWYLIDRSKSGFALSTTIGIAGSILLLLFSPDFVPVPAIHQDLASEKFGVYTWLASILFCTSLCFGAIGRKLQI